MGGLHFAAYCVICVRLAHIAEEAIKKDDIGGDLFDLGTSRIVRALSRGDQQAKNQSGYRPDETRTEPYNVSYVVTEMVVR
jgi:hypothetical protein